MTPMKIVWRRSIYILVLLLALCRCVRTAPQWQTASDGHKYLVDGDAKLNWAQASDECARRGLQLAVINSSAKSNALIAKLRSVFGGARDIWLGHHDEFNSKQDTKRPFYSASTGEKITFGYWNSGEPNNKNNREYCTQMLQKADYKWNDEECDKFYMGYVCEEHQLTLNYRQDMTKKRQSTNQKNTQLATDFTNTQNRIKETNVNTRLNTDNLLLQWKRANDEIMVNHHKSLHEMLLKKPYMEAVIRDFEESYNKLAQETQQEMTKTADQTRQSVQDIHLNGEKSTTSINTEFAGKMSKTKNEIDQMLVY